MTLASGCCSKRSASSASRRAVWATSSVITATSARAEAPIASAIEFGASSTLARRVAWISAARGARVRLDNGLAVVLSAGFVAGTRPDGTPNLSHGWARTIDGAQGGTWEQVHLLAGSNLDRLTAYVGQSRGRRPTHTWNTTPERTREEHGNVVIDPRDLANHCPVRRIAQSDSPETSARSTTYQPASRWTSWSAASPSCASATSRRRW